MFNESEFGSRVQLPEVYFIHKRTDEKDAAPRATQEIFRCEGIGEGSRIESFALIRDADDEILAGVFKGGGDALFRIVGVAMKDSVDGSFTYGHAEAEGVVLIDASVARHLFGGLFDFVDAVERGFERVCDAGFFLSPQVAFPRFMAIPKFRGRPAGMRAGAG